MRWTGADLGFSRGGGGGGGGFSQIFVDLFFIRSTRIDFPSSPKALKRPCFGQILCAAGKILKKAPKKAF